MGVHKQLGPEFVETPPVEWLLEVASWEPLASCMRRNPALTIWHLEACADEALAVGGSHCADLLPDLLRLDLKFTSSQTASQHCRRSSLVSSANPVESTFQVKI